MSTDIFGAIECLVPGPPSTERSWLEVLKLDLLYQGVDYDAFGCLFGIQNYAHFAPVAADRGLPPDVASSTGQRLTWESAFGFTWVTWRELAAIDWEERAELPDSRLHRFRRVGSDLVYEGKSAWSQEVRDLTGLPISEGVAGERTWPEGQEWTMGDVTLRSVRLRRRDAIDQHSGWQVVFGVMKALAAKFGDQGVRLVVCFDC